MAVNAVIKFEDIRKRLERANYIALNNVASIMLEDINNYVPMHTGALRASGTYEFEKNDTSNSYKTGINFSWERPDLVTETREGEEKIFPGEEVTEKVYQGFNPVTNKPIQMWTTPHTGAFWDKIAVEEKLDTWQQNFTEDFTEQFRQHKIEKEIDINFK